MDDINKKELSEIDICDTLKTRLSESQTTQTNRADAMVKQAINPEAKK